MRTEGVSSYHIGGIGVDVVNHQVTADGHDLRMPDLSYRLLRTLCECAPDVASKDEIAREVWQHEAVSDETIAQRVTLLRKALADAGGADAIVSVRGRGYRIARPVTVSARAGLRSPVSNIDAYNAYLLGRHFTFEQTESALEQAVQHLGRAIALEPAFGAAHCALGWAYCFQGTSYGNVTPKDVFHRAKTAAMQAISLDPNSAEAHSLLADILTWYDWDFVGAEREHRRSLSIHRGASLGYALMLSALERHDEAIELVDALMRERPDDAYVLMNAAWRYLDARQFDEAAVLARQASKHIDAAAIDGIAQLMLGDIDGARRVFSDDLTRNPEDPNKIANLARAAYLCGDASEGEALEHRLRHVDEQRYVSPFTLATPRFAAGDADAGFRLLEAGIEARAREMIFLKVTTVLDGYREAGRYQNLLQKVGLPA